MNGIRPCQVDTSVVMLDRGLPQCRCVTSGLIPQYEHSCQAEAVLSFVMQEPSPILPRAAYFNYDVQLLAMVSCRLL